MRLIDADKLENDIVDNITVKAVSRMLAITQGQPTVKAIPIEWLMKKADEWATKDITYDGKPFTAQQVGLAIASMVIDWEKENENN